MLNKIERLMLTRDKLNNMFKEKGLNNKATIFDKTYISIMSNKNVIIDLDYDKTKGWIFDCYNSITQKDFDEISRQLIN